jgi:HlyD family secretion protein
MRIRAAWTLLALAGALTLGACSDPVPGDFSSARTSDLVVTVEATGALKADRSAFLGPPLIPNVWTYKVLWMAAEGREVRKGEPVVRFDTGEMQQELQKMEAERDRAAREMEKQDLETRTHRLELEGEISEAKARLRRVRMKLEVPEDLKARVELAKDRLDLELAEAEVQSLEEQERLGEESVRAQNDILERRRARSADRVRVLQEGIAAMQVGAPREGIVVYVAGWRGEKPKPGDSAYRMQKILEVADLARMGAEAEIAEADAGRVRVGQPVRLRMEADPEKAIRGTVEEISPGIRRQSWSSPLKIRTAAVRLEGERPPWVRPGMRFRAEFEVERVRDVLVIPLDRVVPGPEGPRVLVPGAFGDTEVDVKLGRCNQTEVEVLAGLRPGQRIRRPSGSEPRGSRRGGSS